MLSCVYVCERVCFRTCLSVNFFFFSFVDMKWILLILTAMMLQIAGCESADQYSLELVQVVSILIYYGIKVYKAFFIFFFGE